MTNHTEVTGQPVLGRAKTQRVLARRKSHAGWVPYACLSPAVLLITMFVAWPLLSVFYYSLQTYNVTQPWLNGFVGLKNFATILFDDKIFRTSLLVSLKWVVLEVALQFIIGFAVALLLNRTFRGRGLMRSLVFSPWAVAGVVVTATWTLMYQPLGGMLDTMLMRTGIISSPIQWLADSSTVFGSVVVAELWRGVPFFTIILLAGLQSIPGDLYEAAAIDGARRFQTFRRITLPLMKDTIILATLLRGVWEFNNVDVIYTMTNGGPGTATTTLPIYIVNQAVQYHNFGYGSALSVISFAILLIFALVYLKLGRFGQES